MASRRFNLYQRFHELFKDAYSGESDDFVADIETEAKVEALRWLFLHSDKYKEAVEYFQRWFDNHKDEYKLSYPRVTTLHHDTICFTVCRSTVHYDDKASDIVTQLSIDMMDIECLKHSYSSAHDTPPASYNCGDWDETILYDLTKGENQDYEQITDQL
jgi:hypothetical protein